MAFVSNHLVDGDSAIKPMQRRSYEAGKAYLVPASELYLWHSIQYINFDSGSPLSTFWLFSFVSTSYYDF